MYQIILYCGLRTIQKRQVKLSIEKLGGNPSITAAQCVVGKPTTPR